MDQLVARVAIERSAEALATKYGGPPTVLDSVAGALGIIEITFGDIDDSALLLRSPLKGLLSIIVNRTDVPTRRRFSIAHELGHVALDIVGIEQHYRSRIAARAEQNSEERACDYFAACLLMPRPWVLERAAGGITARQLARRFDVSVPAMRARLHELGLHAIAAT